jgi:hypothetical protein
MPANNSEVATIHEGGQLKYGEALIIDGIFGKASLSE